MPPPKTLAEAARGIGVTVVDMPSIDEGLLLQAYDSGRTLIFAEQNNGYIWQNFLKVLYRQRKASVDLERVAAIHTLDSQGRARFIHSGTYEELVEAFGLTAAQIAEFIAKRVLRVRHPRSTRRSRPARAQPSSQRGGHLYHERIGPRPGRWGSGAGSRGIRGFVSAGCGAHAAQHQR